MADNLVQRGGLWHVRLDIPKDVQAAFGNRRILSQSLHTGSRLDAMRLRLPILAEWKAQIQAVREQKKAKGDAWRERAFETSQSVAEFLRLRTLDLAGIQPIQPPTPEQMAEVERHMVDGEIDRKDIEFFGPTFHFDIRGKPLEQQLAQLQELAKWIKDGERTELLREFTLPKPAIQELDSILSDSKSYKPKSPITTAMLDAWAAHLQTQIKTPKTRDMQINRVQRLSNYLTAEGLALNFDSVHRFLDSVSSARQTRANYLWSGRSFWKWATKYHQGFRDQFSQSPCPFDGHELPKQGKAAGQSYVAFTRAEVERLHAQALTKGDTDLANLIALGAYTGARLEELGRLKPEDAILDDKGQPIGFRIKEAKTEAGIREVPLHPAIVPLFVQLVEQAPENDGYLFKGGKNKYGNRLDGLSKKFGRLKAKNFSDLYCFHSIRKTTTTELHQRGVTMEVLPYIIGHETKAFTLDVYSAGSSFQQKQEAIYKLEFSLTLPPA